MSVAVSLADSSLAVVDEVLRLAANRLSSPNVRSCFLCAMTANDVPSDFVNPAVTVWVRNCMYTVTLTHVLTSQYSYEQPLVLPQLLHL